MDALDRVPVDAASDVDTSMQTDAYNPNELWHDDDSTSDVSDAAADASRRLEVGGLETEDLSSVRGPVSESPDAPERTAEDRRRSDVPTRPDGTDDDSPEDEAQRAARAALQRWNWPATE
jgi:hypothetical protein